MADAQTAADGLGLNPPATMLTGSYGPGMVRNALTDIQQTKQQEQQLTAPVYAKMQENVARDQSRFDRVAKDYEPFHAPPPPQVPQNDPFSAFASVAGVFATLAARVSKTPATAAMNALGKAISAAKTNDWETYEAQYKQWKDSTDIALQKHRLQAQDMRDAMEMMQTDITTGTAMAKAVAAQSEDHIATQLLALGQYEQLGQYQLAQQRTSAAMAEAAARIQETHLAIQEHQIKLQQEKDQARLGQELVQARQSGDPDRVATATQALKDHYAATDANFLLREQGGSTPQAIALNRYLQEFPNASGTDIQKFLQGFKAPSASASKEADAQTMALEKFKEIHGRDPTEQDGAEMARLRVSTRTEAGGVISDEAADFVAGRVLAGDERATVGMARSNANMTKVANAMVALAKKQNVSPNELAVRIAEFQGTVAGERTLGTRAANMEVAANVVKQMAPLALEASAKVNRSDFPTLNSVILAADRGTGGEDVVRFGQAANAIIYEYAKFLNPSGIPTDSDKAKATDILNTAWTQGQFAAAIDQIVNKEIPTGQAAITSTRQEFREGLGTRLSPPQGGPAPGTIEQGYRFKGGNPADQSNWEKVQ